MEKFCQHCGEKQNEKNKFCIKCGKTPFKNYADEVNVEKAPDPLVDDSDLDTGVRVVSFCFPFVGGILWLVHMKKSPKKSKQACSAAVWGIIVGIVLNILGAA